MTSTGFSTLLRFRQPVTTTSFNTLLASTQLSRQRHAISITSTGSIRTLTTAFASVQLKPSTQHAVCQHASHRSCAHCLLHSSSHSLRSFTTSTAAHQATTSSLNLQTLRSVPGSHKQKDRVGRGIGSRMGKTAKRGHKGQGARSGAKFRFEGGQTPIWQRTPKRGFKPPNRRPLEELNVSDLMYAVHSQRIPHKGTTADNPITLKDLYDTGLVSRVRHGIKLLGRGLRTIDQPIHIEVTDCTVATKNAIQAAGGSVKLVYYNRVGLRSHLHPEKWLNDALRPSTVCIPPPALQAKYQYQWASGEEHEKIETVREKMVREGKVLLK